MTTATGQAGKKRPQATAQVGAGTEELDKDEEAWEEGAKYTDIEESESDEEPAPLATKLLRQLRGTSKAEEVERWSEVAVAEGSIIVIGVIQSAVEVGLGEEA